MDTDPTIKTRLLSRPVRSRLGTIQLAGLNKSGFGVGVHNQTLRTLPHYALNYVLGGEGIYRDDQTRVDVPVVKDDLVIYFPGKPHASGTLPGQYWDELWFEFYGPVFDLMRSNGILNPARPITSAKGSNYWLRRITNILPPAHLRSRVSADSVVLHFAHVLTEMLQSSANEVAAAPEDDWMHKACVLLADEEADPATSEPQAVAKKLGLPYETFRKLFKASMGVAPGKYRLDARMDHAVALIYQGRHSVREIADLLGFCDEFYFSRLFKQRFGRPPREFRKKLRGH